MRLWSWILLHNKSNAVNSNTRWWCVVGNGTLLHWAQHAMAAYLLYPHNMCLFAWPVIFFSTELELSRMRIHSSRGRLSNASISIACALFASIHFTLRWPLAFFTLTSRLEIGVMATNDTFALANCSAAVNDFRGYGNAQVYKEL